MGSKEKNEAFLEALRGKQIPILTLDNKWYRLLDKAGRETAGELTEELNGLLKRQGKLTTETKDIKRLKKKLMAEIVSMVNENEQDQNPEIDDKIEENKRLIEDCNEKLEAYRDELLELPGEIKQVNFQLMLLTMECCYEIMKENSSRIEEISQWVADMRVELKKNLIRKQEMERQNQDIYAYMHDVFGVDVIDLFDMKREEET